MTDDPIPPEPTRLPPVGSSASSGKVAGKSVTDERQPRQQHQPPPEDEAGKHFAELAAAAEEAHRTLVLKRSPYRFCVYRQGDRVMIDLVLLDDEGRQKGIQRRDITHDLFRTWLEHIAKGEGLFFDSAG